MSVQLPGETQVGSTGLRTFDGKLSALGQPLSTDLQADWCFPESHRSNPFAVFGASAQKLHHWNDQKWAFKTPKRAVPAVACPDPVSHLLPSPLSSFIAQ